MAVNKKIKSFSPYNYNVQYAKPGAGINQKGKQYIKSSPVNQEEYVVTRKLPSFFAHLSNVFHYTISDECEIKFLKAVSTFSIKKDGTIPDFENVSEAESKIALMEYTITNNSSMGSNSILLNHTFFTSNVDCIAILNDSKYLKFKMRKINDRSVELILNEEIKLSTTDYIKVILYPLENSFNLLNNNISYKTFEYDDLIFDDLKEKIAIDNKLGTSKLIPIVYDLFDSSYLLEGFDLNPCYIAFNMSNFPSKTSLIKENEKLEKEMMMIRNENANLTTDQLVSLNNNYKIRKEKYDSNLLIINNLIKVDREYNIDKVLLYKINKESFIINLGYNIDNSSVTWCKEGNNIVAVVRHGLNCEVKVVLDREDVTNYDIYKIDSNTIKINFGTLKPKTCVLNIFKVV